LNSHHNIKYTLFEFKKNCKQIFRGYPQMDYLMKDFTLKKINKLSMIFDFYFVFHKILNV
jgi:hypothetical protein